MAITDKYMLLRWALFANSVFSMTSGLVLLFYLELVSAHLGGIPFWWVHLIGTGLLIFAISLILVARKQAISIPVSMLIIGADFSWIIGSAILLFMGIDIVSYEAKWLIFGIACVVFIFAELQLMGVLRLLRNDRVGPKQAAVFERLVPVPSHVAWNIVSDVAGYAQYVSSISASKVLSGSGKGLVRECQEPKGGCWTEQCTFWEEGKGYGFRVDTDADDYPFPFRELQAEWRVLPQGDNQSLIRIRFELTMPWGILGEILLAIVYFKHKRVVMQLLENWTRAMVMNPLANSLSPHNGGEFTRLDRS